MAFYPFDPNGNLASNLITNEAHALNTINGVDHQYMVPRNAPFFDASMVVVDQASGQILTRGIDYDLGYTFQAGLDEVGVGLSGAVYLIDKNRSGTFVLRYQTLGGDFVTATTRALTDGLATLNDLTLVNWDAIAPGTLPTTWPPTPHTQPVTDVEAVQELIDGINNVVNALTSAPPYIHVDDIIDFDAEYTTMIEGALGDVANAIQANRDKSLNYEQFSIPLNPTKSLSEAGGDGIGTWLDVGLISTASVDGTYLVNTHIKPLFNPGINPVYRTRFVISTNSGVSYNVIPESYASGIRVGLAANWLIKLQIYFHESYTSAILASDDANSEVGTYLTLVRLGS